MAEHVVCSYLDAKPSMLQPAMMKRIRRIKKTREGRMDFTDRRKAIG